MFEIEDPARIDLRHAIRTVSFEHPTGARGSAGAALGGRKGAPLVLPAPGTSAMPHFVSFYRWQLPDPIGFAREPRVTLPQLGAVAVPRGQREMRARHRVAGAGWVPIGGALDSFGICERVDDVCATACVDCRDAQAVPRLDVAAACAELARRDCESASPFEAMLEVLKPRAEPARNR